MIDRLRTWIILGWKGYASNILQSFSITTGKPTTDEIPPVQLPKLDASNRRVYRVQSGRIPDSRHRILRSASTVPKRPGVLCDNTIISNNHSTITRNSHVLARVEREASDITHRSSPFSLDLGSMGLARIFDKPRLTVRR